MPSGLEKWGGENKYSEFDVTNVAQCGLLTLGIGLAFCTTYRNRPNKKKKRLPTYNRINSYRRRPTNISQFLKQVYHFQYLLLAVQNPAMFPGGVKLYL